MKFSDAKLYTLAMSLGLGAATQAELFPTFQWTKARCSGQYCKYFEGGASLVMIGQSMCVFDTGTLLPKTLFSYSSTSSARGLYVTPDEKYVVTIRPNGPSVLGAYDLKTGKYLNDCALDGYFVGSNTEDAIFVPNLPAGLGLQKRAVPSGDVLADFDPLAKQVSAMAVSEDGHYLAYAAVVNDLPKVRLVDLTTNSVVATYDRYVNPFSNGIGFNKDGTYVVATEGQPGSTSRVFQWNVSTGTRTVVDYWGGIVTIKPLNDPHIVVMESSTGWLYWFDVTTQTTANSVHVGNATLSPMALDVSPDGQEIATRDGLGHVNFLDANTGALLRTSYDPVGNNRYGAMSGSGRRMVVIDDTAGPSFKWNVFNVVTGSFERTITVPGYNNFAAVKPNSDVIAGTSSNDRVPLIDVSTGQVVRELVRGFSGPARGSFSPDGTLYLDRCVGSDSSLTLFRVSDGQILWQQLHWPIGLPRYSPWENVVGFGQGDKFTLYDASTMLPLWTSPTYPNLYDFGFTRDRKYVVLVDYTRKSLIVLDRNDGHQIREIVIGGVSTSFALSPIASQALIVSNNRYELVDLETGLFRLSYDAPNTSFTKGLVGFTPSGRYFGYLDQDLMGVAFNPFALNWFNPSVIAN